MELLKGNKAGVLGCIDGKVSHKTREGFFFP